MARPRLPVLDEPTSGLDVVVRDDFLEATASFVAEDSRRAVLLSTHMIDDVARICDRAVVLRESAPRSPARSRSCASRAAATSSASRACSRRATP